MSQPRGLPFPALSVARELTYETKKLKDTKMSRIKSIEDRLFEKADAELRERIEQAAKPMDTFLRNGCGHTIKPTPVKGEPSEVTWYVCLAALKERAFELHRDTERERHIKEFMEQLTTFSADYAHVQQLITNAQEE